MTHIWRPWKLSNFQDLQLTCSSTFKILRPLSPWASNLKRTLPSSPNDTVHVNERNQNKNKNLVTSYSDWARVLLFDLAHKQCSGMIKGWFHCMTSESEGRFLVNNILFGLSWSLVMAQIQFSLIKK